MWSTWKLWRIDDSLRVECSYSPCAPCDFVLMPCFCTVSHGCVGLICSALNGSAQLDFGVVTKAPRTESDTDQVKIQEFVPVPG